jgi:hypothetical protein
MIELYAFFGYLSLSIPEKNAIFNGAGAKNDWRTRFIPDTLYGLECLVAFNIHDHAYSVGKTNHDKKLADYFLLINLFEIINSYGGFLRWFRRRRALKYYEAVLELGEDSFFINRDSDYTGFGYQDGRRFDIVRIRTGEWQS